MKKTLVDCLREVKDYRNGNGIEHKLIDILVIAILGVLCGSDGFVEIEEFGNAKKEWLNKFLELPNGIPSHDTFGRIFASIEPKEFHGAFIEWVKNIGSLFKGELIAIDGKTIRRSKDKAKGKAALHIVSAWASENKMVLGQRKVEDKTNEITAIPELLKMLDISGCIISIDAMGTQKDIATQIIKGNGDYVLALKKNQETLYNDVELFFKDEMLNKREKEKKEMERENKYCKTLDKSHGRYEKREYYISNEIDWLLKRHSWDGLSGIGLCVSERTENEKKTVEYSDAIYSIKNCTAEIFAKYKRGHWSVENSLHWVLDIAFREDESRARKDHCAENLNIVRHMTLNLLKQEKTCKRGIKTKRLKCGWDEPYLLKVLQIDDIGI